MSSTDNERISVRVDARLVQRAEALIDHVSEETGRSAKLADVWREALLRGLRELERSARKTGT